MEQSDAREMVELMEREEDGEEGEEGEEVCEMHWRKMSTTVRV